MHFYGMLQAINARSSIIFRKNAFFFTSESKKFFELFFWLKLGGVGNLPAVYRRSQKNFKRLQIGRFSSTLPACATGACRLQMPCLFSCFHPGSCVALE
jgi:hypothetical protein